MAVDSGIRCKFNMHILLHTDCNMLFADVSTHASSDLVAAALYTAHALL